MKYLIACLAIALLMGASWAMGNRHGYKKGAEQEAKRFQVMLDSNVYWAHRDSLRSMQLGNEHTAKFHKESLTDYHERVMEASDKNPNLDSTIKLNFINHVTQGHDEILALAEELIEKSAQQN